MRRKAIWLEFIDLFCGFVQAAAISNNFPWVKTAFLVRAPPKLLLALICIDIVRMAPRFEVIESISIDQD